MVKPKSYLCHHCSDLTTNTLGATANPTPDQSDHYSSYIYDSNGNIMALNRIDDAAPMDELTYTYASTDNRLQRVDDTVGNSDFGTDHDDMTTDFAYYRNGNLQNDPTANIANILWHPNGKLNAIIRDGANDSPTLVFSYDGLGNRVRKVQVARDASGNTLPMSQWDLTYYIRDAQGNHLTTIDRKFTETDEFEATDELNISETVMYGSDRLGIRNWAQSDDGQPASLIARHAFTHSGANTEGEYQAITPSGSPVYSTAPEDYFSSLEGAKHYELKNHLGNVLATVSDKRDVEVDGSYNVESYTAKISDVSFYYPFGSLMPGLSDFGGEHRFGFNGMEKDNEVYNSNGGSYDYKYRIYNANLGRFLSIDQLASSFPYYSPFQFAGNKPIIAIDLDGLEEYVIIRWYDANNKYTGSSALRVRNERDRRYSDTGILYVELSDNEENRVNVTKAFKSQSAPSIIFSGLSGSLNEALNPSFTFDVRNNEDRNMLNKAFAASIASKPGNQVISSPLLKSFHFGKGSSELSASMKSELGKMAEFLEDNPDYSIHIDGYASKLGDGSSNDKLAARRADAMREFLVGSGVNEARVVTSSFGDKKATENHDDSQRSDIKFSVDKKVGN